MRVTEQSPFRGPEAQRLADQAASPGSPPGRKLPVAPRERRPALAALAILLIIGGALITTVIFIQSGDRVSAIAVAQRVGAGQPIPVEALKEVQIAVTDIQYIPWSARAEVARNYAAVDLVPGTLLNDEMVALASSELRPGKAVVGLSLKPGQVPSGLQRGDRVQVVYVPGENDGGVSKVLAARALVNSVGGGQSSTGSGSTTVSVIVDTGAAATIVGYASSGKIGLAYLPGLPADGSAGPQPTGDPSATPSTGPDDATGEPEPNASKSAKAPASPKQTPTRGAPTAQNTPPKSRPTAKPTSRPSGTPTGAGDSVDGQG